MANIFFDLDGTLINSSCRLYELFVDLVPECKMTKDEYWILKRAKINHEMILEKYFPTYSFKDFNTKWLELIETEKYLNKNKLKAGVEKLLAKLSVKNELYIVTARQNKEFTYKELDRFGIKHFFKEIMVTEDKISKAELIKMKVKIDPEDLFVGDTGFDIKTGKDLGIKTIAVSDGFLSADNLKEYKPDYIITNVLDFEQKEEVANE